MNFCFMRRLPPPLPLIPTTTAQTGAPKVRDDTVPSHAVEGGRRMEPVGATRLLHAPRRGEYRVAAYCCSMRIRT